MANRKWQIANREKMLRRAIRDVRRADMGFTLIELLVVVALLGIMMVVGTNTFIGVLKSSAKSSIINKLRENGNTSVEHMSRKIQNAAEVVAKDETDPSCRKWIVVQNKIVESADPLYTKFTINQHASNNGYIGISSGDNLTTLTASGITADPITDNTNTPGAVDVLNDAGLNKSCILIREYTSASGENFTVVIVKFTLKESKFVPAGRQEFASQINFRTIFTLRVY